MELVFTGDTGSLPDGTTFSRYGQRFEMDQAEAEALVRNHPSPVIMPAAPFDLIFPPGPETEAMLAKYPSRSAQESAPGDVKAQIRAASVARDKWIDGVEKAGQDAPTAESRSAPPEAA